MRNFLIVASLAVCAVANAEHVATIDQNFGIYLLDPSVSTGIVDFSGNTGSSAVGTGYAVAWDPTNGDLMAISGGSLFRNHNSIWTNEKTYNGLTFNASTDLAVSPTGRTATIDQNGGIYLLDPSFSTGIVDFSGNTSSSTVGNGFAVAWDPTNGDLMAISGNSLFRNHNGSWVNEKSYSGLTFDASTDLAVSPTGRIATIDQNGGIYLLDPSSSTGIVDFSGNTSSSAVGNGFAVAWDPTNGDLMAISGNSLFRNHNGSWVNEKSYSGLTFNASTDLAVVPEPHQSLFILVSVCAGLGFCRLRNRARLAPGLRNCQ